MLFVRPAYSAPTLESLPEAQRPPKQLDSLAGCEPLHFVASGDRNCTALTGCISILAGRTGTTLCGSAAAAGSEILGSALARCRSLCPRAFATSSLSSNRSTHIRRPGVLSAYHGHSQVLSQLEEQLGDASHSSGGRGSAIQINATAGRARHLRGALGIAGSLPVCVLHHHCSWSRMQMQPVHRALR